VSHIHVYSILMLDNVSTVALLKGDSGGPLVCYEEGHWLLYGATSWVSLKGCGASTGPPVYARVSAYVGWISVKISENSD